VKKDFRYLGRFRTSSSDNDNILEELVHHNPCDLAINKTAREQHSIYLHELGHRIIVSWQA
jgi:hypothetical protein